MAFFCASRDALVKALANKHDEHLSGLGIVTETQILEVFVSALGTWTITISNFIDGMTCVMASGKHWETVQRVMGTPL